MKVKIGNKIYDSKNEPILIMLNESDKKNINEMLRGVNNYVCYPDNIDSKIIIKWAKQE